MEDRILRTEIMKNTMSEKEIELDGWIKKRASMLSVRILSEWPWFAVDTDGRGYLFYERPNFMVRAPFGRGVWVEGNAEPIFLGRVPNDLELWEAHDFLLKFGEVKPYAVLTHTDGSQTVWDGPGQVGRRVPALTPDSCPLTPLFFEGHGGETPPPRSGPSFEREVWTASVMGQAMRLRVSIVEEAMPSPQEVAHWRLPTDEELDMELPGGWTDRCPVDI